MGYDLMKGRYSAHAGAEGRSVMGTTTTGMTGREVKAALVECVKDAVDAKFVDEDSAWGRHAKAEVAELRALAKALRTLPDDDARLCEITTLLHGDELPLGLLEEMLNPPGIHPNADPELPDVDSLLDGLLDALDKPGEE